MKAAATVVFLQFASLAMAESASSDSLMREALEQRHAGNLVRAEELICEAQRCATSEGEFRQMFREHGAVLLELGEYERAELLLSWALSGDPAADTAFDLAIARFHLKKWDEAWKACDLCLKWAGEGSRLKERAAEIGMAIAGKLEDGTEAYREIAKWAAETESGKGAAEKLK